MRIRPLVRRLSSLGRLFVALLVLVAVWLVALRGVDHATKEAEGRRLEDRKALARGYASLLRNVIGNGRATATDLATRIAERKSTEVITEYLRSATDYNEVVVLQAGDKVAAAPGLAVTPNVPLRKCGDDGRLSALASAALAGQTVVGLVAVPWDCGIPRLAAVAPSGLGAIVALAQVHPGYGRIGPSLLGGTAPAGDYEFEVIPPDYFTAVQLRDPGDRRPLQTSERKEFIDGSRGKPIAVGRFAGVISFYADAGDGWGVTVEQRAGALDGPGLPSQPVIVGATAVAAALAVAFILLAFFDRRRRKAHARSEDAKHAFFATVGHELRTPLTILRGYSDTLTARWDSLSDESKEMLVSNMAPAAQRMGSLVEKLLLASNIQAEAYVKPVPRPTPVPDVLRRVADRWRPLAPLHTFVVDADPLLPEAIADADALEQVLQQLVDNAVKYSPSGGRVVVSAMRSRKGIEVAVTDEGVGLPHNVRGIFEPLVQGEAVDTRVHDEGGAGVGLYIVRTLVRDMGGDVRAERREVEGSRFVVTLKPARTKAASRSVSPV